MSSGEFPPRIPIFPLSNVVLFPDTTLPLHIFEPRYRAMTEDALGAERVIGMALLKSGGQAPALGAAPVFDVGCVGHVGESQQLPDGRFNLLLHGERRFRIVEQEVTTRGYIVADVELLDDPGFEAFDAHVRTELERAREEVEQRVVELAQLTAPRGVRQLRQQMRGLDPVELTHALAFGLNCGVVEKQSLLEAPDPLERARLLARLVEFKTAEERLPNDLDAVN